eukprot:1774396-Pleurochrysis_carterae.AAC.3
MKASNYKHVARRLLPNTFGIYMLAAVTLAAFDIDLLSTTALPLGQLATTIKPRSEILQASYPIKDRLSVAFDSRKIVLMNNKHSRRRHQKHQAHVPVAETARQREKSSSKRRIADALLRCSELRLETCDQVAAACLFGAFGGYTLRPVRKILIVRKQL